MKKRIPVWLPLLITILALTQAVAQPGKGRNERTNDRYEDYDNYPEREACRYDRRNPGYRGAVYVVRRVPNTPRMHPGQQPSPMHVWVSTEFFWQNGKYRPVPGSWAMPLRRGMRYVPGYWQPVRGGYTWVSGYWSPARGRYGRY